MGRSMAAAWQTSLLDEVEWILPEGRTYFLPGLGGGFGLTDPLFGVGRLGGGAGLTRAIPT